MRLFAIVLSWACLVFGADKNSVINGVWRAQVDGLPALVITVSDEGGDLAGAVLFYLIRRDTGQPPKGSPGIPEPLFNLGFDGKTLDFRVSHRRAHGARKSTRLNSSHGYISYAVFCLKKKKSEQARLVRSF